MHYPSCWTNIYSRGVNHTTVSILSYLILSYPILFCPILSIYIYIHGLLHNIHNITRPFKYHPKHGFKNPPSCWKATVLRLHAEGRLRVDLLPPDQVTSQAGAALRRSPATGCRKITDHRPERGGGLEPGIHYWWKITIFNGRTHYEFGHFWNSYVRLNHQRVSASKIDWGSSQSGLEGWFLTSQQKYGRTEVLKMGALLGALFP